MTAQNILGIGVDEIRRGRPVNVATQIANAIRDRILAGQLRTGDQLPGQRTLAEQLSCNRDAIKEAYRQLAGKGYLIVRDRATPQVRTPPPVRMLTNERYRDVVDAITTHGADAFDPSTVGFCVDYGCTWDEVSVMAESSVDRASDDVRERLDLPREGRVLIRHMVESARGVPVQIRLSVMPAWLAEHSEIALPYRQPWPGGTVGELMHQGYTPSRVVEDWRTRPATADEAAALYLSTGMQVWSATRVFYAVMGIKPLRPLETSTLVLPDVGNTLRLVTNL